MYFGFSSVCTKNLQPKIEFSVHVSACLFLQLSVWPKKMEWTQRDNDCGEGTEHGFGDWEERASRG